MVFLLLILSSWFHPPNNAYLRFKLATNLLFLFFFFFSLLQVKYSREPDNPTKCIFLFPLFSLMDLLWFLFKMLHLMCLLVLVWVFFFFTSVMFSPFTDIQFFFFSACKARGSDLRVHFKVGFIPLRCSVVVWITNQLGSLWTRFVLSVFLCSNFGVGS